MKRSQKLIRRLSVLVAAMLSLCGLTLVQSAPASALDGSGSMEFGEVPVGQPTTQRFSFELDAGYTGRELRSQDLSLRLSSSACDGASCHVDVTITPGHAGRYEGAFTIRQCAPDGGACAGPTLLVGVFANAIDVTSGTMTASPVNVHPGGSVTATSITPCPGATTSIRLSLFNANGMELADAEPSLRNGGGTWAGTIVVPLEAQAATYFVTATCRGVLSAQYYNYVPIEVAGVVVTTTTALSSSANPASYGQPVTFTATVSPQSGSSTPTGSVTFADGSTTLGTATLSGGVAHFATSGLAVGSHVITATYAGSLTASSTTLAQTVQKAPTALVAATVKRANPTPFSATLTSAGSPIANQTVTFTTKNAFGTQLQCTATTNASGVATCHGKNKLALSLFSTYTATFAGTANYAASSAIGKLIQ